MCSRFFVPQPMDSPEELLAVCHAAEVRRQKTDPGFALPGGEIFPGMWAAVVAPDKCRVPAAYAMRWGFVMQKAPAPYQQLSLPGIPDPKPREKLLFNVRSEGAGIRPLFADSFATRRCLIPCAGYFEWDHRLSPPPKLRFFWKDEPILWLGGIYRVIGEKVSFAVLTMDAQPSIAAYHPRMPVMIPAALHEAWLDARIPPQEILRQVGVHAGLVARPAS